MEWETVVKWFAGILEFWQNPSPYLPNLFLALIPCNEKKNSRISLITNTREYTYLYPIEDDEKQNKIKIE